MKKLLNNLDERKLLKMATEKAYKEYKDNYDDRFLKEILKKVLKKEKIYFTYTYRINDCRKYGTMHADDFKKYEEMLRNLNYTSCYFDYDGEFTKECD